MSMNERGALVVNQLSYLIDEVKALEVVVPKVPEALLVASPVEGEPSIIDLLRRIAALDRDVRIPVVRGLLSESQIGERMPAPPSSESGVEGLLTTIREARSELLRMVREVADVETARVVVDGEDMMLVDYLYHVAQEDTATLRQAAERMHESRPLGSPGFTRRSS